MFCSCDVAELDPQDLIIIFGRSIAISLQLLFLVVQQKHKHGVAKRRP
jgi:hypothetical protein